MVELSRPIVNSNQYGIITTIPTKLRSPFKDYAAHELNHFILAERGYESFINLYIYIYIQITHLQYHLI